MSDSIAITSGKGGVGKTTIAVNLSIALKKISSEVYLLDTDLGMANSHVLLGVNPEHSISDVINNKKKISEIIVPSKSGVKLIFQKCENNSYLNLKKISQKIYKLGLHRLLIESGKDLMTNFLNENLLNEFYFFKSDKFISNRNKINVSSLIKMINKYYKNKKKINTYLGNDTLTHYY